MSQIKIYLKYILGVIKGDEFMSEKDRFTIFLNFCAIVHIIDCVPFFIFGNVLLVIWNLLAFLLYEGLIPVARNKQFRLVTIISSAEVRAFVTLTTLFYGSNLNFNMYCLLIIPAVFYASITSRSYKKPLTTALIVSILSAAVFIFSELFPGTATIPDKYHTLSIIIKINNICAFCILNIIISFLFMSTVRSSKDELESKQLQYHELSSKDPLTKLANRRSMAEKLNLAMHHLKRDKQDFSLILGDIDNFKRINDTYGHDCGDKVLVMVSDVISGQMRDGDFVCRWGGEEILILVKGNLESATTVAERILDRIRENEIIHENQIVKVTMTFGVAQGDERIRIEDVIQMADSRLYYGKQHGKNRVVNQNNTEHLTNR